MATTSTPVGDSTAFLGEPGLDRLYDNVQATLPGAPPLPLVQMQAWNAISDFATRSTWYRSEAPWGMAPGQVLYDFNPYDANFTVCWVLGQCGLSRWRVSPPATLVDLTPGQPTETRRGTATVVLRPLRLDGNLPADLFDTWFQATLSGTLGRLCLLPGKPWTDNKLGLTHMQLYNAEIGKARDIARRNYSDGADWSYPYFAAGRRR